MVTRTNKNSEIMKEMKTVYEDSLLKNAVTIVITI